MSKNSGPTHILAKVIKFGVFLTALIPLIIFNEFISPFHFGKVVIFRSLIEILFAFYLVLAVADKSYRPRANPILFALITFAAIFGLTSLTSVNPYLSFWGSLERMGGFWTFLHYLVFYLIASAILRDKKDWINLLKFFVWTGFISALYGFGQRTNSDFFIGGGNRLRIFGTIGNAALFAGYQLTLFFVGLSLALSDWVRKDRKWFYFLIVGLNALAILMTAVRGSIVGLGLGLLVFVGLYLKNFQSEFSAGQKAMVKRIFVGLLILAAIFASLIFIFQDSGFVQRIHYLNRITDFSLSADTVETRIWAWRAGLTGWLESAKTMIFGFGPENFNVPFSEHFNPQFYRGLGSETLFDRAHNMFVEILVTMGILGFLAYVGIFFFSFKSSSKIIRQANSPDGDKNLKIFGVGFIALLIAYIIHNAFIFDTSANFLVFFSVLGAMTFFSQTARTDQGGVSLQGKFKIALVILLIGVATLIYKTNILPAKANYATTRAIVRGWAGDFSGAVEKFKESVSYDVPGKYEYRHRMTQYVLGPANSAAITPEVGRAVLDVISEVQKNAEERQRDYLPYLYLSRLNIVLGKADPTSPFNDAALEQANRALAISPNFIRTYYELAQAYLNKKEPERAAEYFQQAIDLNPEVGLSYWYLSIAQFELGDTAGGLASVEAAQTYGFALGEIELLRLVNVYRDSNDFQKLAELYKRLTELDDKNPQYFASLAVAYANAGDIDGAVAAALRAGQLDPTFASEAQAFIRSLGR